ncbi:MAG: 6-carboxytetrahydropterin synthase QueD [candidate division KSB1 bacterium]|nr:6-carboxytetrahydropterin synthase QueD [candidate division KSB1 bacterium]MDZ7342749.1 6-carboxytetrahydropterin synthase QueD [candidate division KSB1 bacterium]
MYQIRVTTRFSAAHRLRNYEGPCENLHGHNWTVTARIGSEAVDALGMVYDFKQLKRQLHGIVDAFDHKFLNEVAPFDHVNPTSENMAKFIFDSLKQRIPPPLRVMAVSVGESENYVATYEES